MTNPFQYGGIVRGEAFCNRQQELADIGRAMENGDKLFVYSERRLGKTSLVQAALARLDTDRFATAYVDLWPTDGASSFVTALARALTEAVSPVSTQLLQTARALFHRLVPTLSMDDEGKPVISFGLRGSGEAQLDLEEVLAAPARASARGKRRVVVVFDEFQRIAEYGDDQVERRLRSMIQHQAEVAYLFLGSRKHLIQSMFLDRDRPLYRAAGHYPLKPIALEHWRPFIREKFLTHDKRITDEHIDAICRLTEGHPFYTQHLCHALWERCEAGGEVTAELISASVEILLERENFAYTALWESLTRSQQRFLRGLAGEPAGTRPFAAEFLRRYGLRSASTAQRAAEALLKKDIVDRDNGSFLISDRFFRLWLQRWQGTP